MTIHLVIGLAEALMLAAVAVALFVHGGWQQTRVRTVVLRAVLGFLSAGTRSPLLASLMLAVMATGAAVTALLGYPFYVAAWVSLWAPLLGLVVRSLPYIVLELLLGMFRGR